MRSQSVINTWDGLKSGEPHSLRGEALTSFHRLTEERRLVLIELLLKAR